MKRILAFVLVCTLLLTAVSAFTVAFAETASLIYLSDDGNDANDGLTKDTPVRCIKTAVERLGGDNAVGTICIVGAYTYSDGDNFYSTGMSSALFPEARRLTITGYDENALFYLNRSSAGTQGEVIFTGLRIRGEGSILYVQSGALTMDESVETVAYPGTASPSDGEAYAKQFPSVYAGYTGRVTRDLTVNLLGGTYREIYLAPYAAPMAGNSSFLIGENATVLQTAHGLGTGLTMDGTIDLEVRGALLGGIRLYASTVRGSMNVRFGRTAEFEGDFRLKSCFAEGYGLCVNAERNAAVSNILREALADSEAQLRLFVEKAPVFVGTQIRQGAGTYDVRFAATVDTLEYSNLGFLITATYGNGMTRVLDSDCKKVYTALSATVNGETQIETAEKYEGQYIYALTVTGIPESLETVTFTVTPYAKDGSDRIGNTYSVICTPVDGGVAVH